MPLPDRKIIYLLGFLVAVVVGWVLSAGAGILQPLAIALLLSGMIQPIVLLLKRWYIPPVLTVIAFAGVMFFGLSQVGLLLRDNIDAFIEGGNEPASGVAKPSESQVEPIDPMDPHSGEEALQSGGWPGVVANLSQRLRDSNLPDDLAELAIKSLEELNPAELAGSLIGEGIGFARGLVLVMIYMLFIFAEAAVFRRKILSVAGERADEAAIALDTIARGIQRYLGVKTLASLATGALCYLGLRVLDVPFALLFGFITFVLNYIPTFGSIVASVFPLATAVANDASFGVVILVGLLYLSVNTLIGNFLEPKILGRELDLSPLVIIISVVTWAGLWGVVGTFLAVPLTSTLQIILASMDTTRPVAILLSSGEPPAHGRPRPFWLTKPVATVKRVRRRRAQSGSDSASDSSDSQIPEPIEPGE